MVEEPFSNICGPALLMDLHEHKGIPLQIKRAIDENILDEKQILNTLIIICDLLKYLHSRDIYHADLHLGNILITDKLTPVIIDFGECCSPILKRRSYGYASGVCPPHIWKPMYRGVNIPFDHRADIYAFGILILTIVLHTSTQDVHSQLKCYDALSMLGKAMCTTFMSLTDVNNCLRNML
jgi:serine/threonine protein kinase